MPEKVFKYRREAQQATERNVHQSSDMNCISKEPYITQQTPKDTYKHGKLLAQNLLESCKPYATCFVESCTLQKLFAVATGGWHH
jgi:hypothetical protein